MVVIQPQIPRYHPRRRVIPQSGIVRLNIERAGFVRAGINVPHADGMAVHRPDPPPAVLALRRSPAKRLTLIQRRRQIQRPR